MPLADNSFTKVLNVFDNRTAVRLYTTTTYPAATKRAMFNPGDFGESPRIKTFTGEVQTSLPSDMGAVVSSDGVEVDSCNPTPTIIRRGEIERTIRTHEKAFASPEFCARDWTRVAKPLREAGVAAYERLLSHNILQFHSNVYRLENIRNVSTKAATVSESDMEFSADNHDPDFTGLSNLPLAELEWTHLERLYHHLETYGNEGAVGTDETGRRIYAIHIPWGYFVKLFLNSGRRWEAIKYNPGAEAELLRKGFADRKAMGGFLPLVDNDSIRFGNGVDPISDTSDLNFDKTEGVHDNVVVPFVNYDLPGTGGNIGRAHKRNPLYLTRANGGRADYDVITVAPFGTYTMMFEVPPITRIGMQTAGSNNYTAQWEWVANPRGTSGDPLGQKGRYWAFYRGAIAPGEPSLGFALITKALD